MARRLLNLRDVPDEEVEALREALEASGVTYYETPPSAFGISAGAIWVRDEADWPEARTLFDRFQREYAEAAREAPPVEPFRSQFKRHPGRIIGFTVAALMILLLMFWPVAELWMS
jgi:hypothetical protein